MNGKYDVADTVVFDLGGVLVDWNPRCLYRRLFDDEAAMERFLAEVCTSAWNEQQDASRPWREAVESLNARFQQHAGLIAACRDGWRDMLGGVIQGSVDLLAELKASGVRLYALTNWSHETLFDQPRADDPYRRCTTQRRCGGSAGHAFLVVPRPCRPARVAGHAWAGIGIGKPCAASPSGIEAAGESGREKRGPRPAYRH